MMKILFSILSWCSGILFFLLFLLSVSTKQWLPAVIILVVSLLLIPPIRLWISNITKIPFPLWLRSLLIPILFILFIILIFKGMGNKYSIYKSPEIEAKIMAIYDARVQQWPVPYECHYINTQYGKVHVIISGPENATPVLLLHASGVASWSWLYNIEGMNKHYRTYAIDTIGDAGKSVLADINNYPKEGKALSELYKEIMDSLGVENATFIGASQGGFISTNMAIYAPERVDKLILCGPMGYTGTNLSVLRILLTTMFPVKFFQKSTMHWAFGDNPKVNEAFGEWFYTLLEGVISRQARPQPFTSEQFESIKSPVLLLLGKRDGLVGNPENTKQVVKKIPNIKVEVLDTGHLISAEKPEQFNKLVYDFIEQQSAD
jgi:pimeloyl-ACP methyl ester carboxylesterase